MSSVVENILPKNWKEKRLGDICKTITKGTTPTTLGFSFVENGINFLKIENIKNDSIDKKSIHKFINSEAHLALKRSQLIEGDILFSIAGTIGSVAKVNSNVLPANTNQALAIIRGYEDFLRFEYLHLFLKNISKNVSKKHARGGALKNISLTDIKNTLIKYPPHQEQKRIVAKINSLFAKIDKAIALTEESLKQAENLLPAVLKQVFENLINEKVPLSEFCSDSKKDMVGGPFGSNLKATEYVDSGYPIIRLQNVDRFGFIQKNIKYVTYDKAEFLRSHSYQKGDIVLTKLGDPLGKCCVVNSIYGIDRGVISSDIVRIRIDETRNFKDYLVAGINSSLIKKQLIANTQGTTRPRVTLKVLRQVTLPRPGYKQQVEIAKKINFINSISLKTQSKLKDQLKYLKNLKSSILSKAFSGEL
ncbi:restriction endonuclease subunit S [Bacteroidota bacterium]|nr:restriction endonuclease subunit S [Bacteroidota bacterium]